MAELDIGQTTTTDLKGTVGDVTVATVQPDQQAAPEIIHNIKNAEQNLGYYKTIPEIRSSLRVLAQRVAGLGYDTDSRTKAILDNITGWGEDSFASICQKLIIEKKVFGDAFCEIIRNDNGTLINLKPLYPGNMRIVVNRKGFIIRYEEVEPGTGNINKFKPFEILHVVNDRIANEIHGTSIIESLKSIIDAKNEAFSDERKIRHRELALGVLEVDTDDSGKITTIKKKYQDAVNKGEVLVIPKGVAELKDSPNAPRDRVQWLMYLDNLFYQVVGTPKVLVTSEGYTEAGGKAGLLAFEPVEIAEKKELEADLWNQCAIKVTFKRAPSLLGEAIETETKNAGQTGIQPNEVEVRPTRTE